MPLKIVRNDITAMDCDAIVNTANTLPVVGPGCDTAIYEAAGYEQMLNARQQIGVIEECRAALTPGFMLKARYVIHAVSPLYEEGDKASEEKLRICYRSALDIVEKQHFSSVAFPLISSGSFGYPKEEALLTAVEEINRFLLKHNVLIYIVVFDSGSTLIAQKIAPKLKASIDDLYAERKSASEYSPMCGSAPADNSAPFSPLRTARLFSAIPSPKSKESQSAPSCEPWEFMEQYGDKLKDRIAHRADGFQPYFFYLLEQKKLENLEVRRRAYVKKRLFSKLKNNPKYHPDKLTALCLCVGAQLNIDETRDLLARAGYALSPGDVTDIIFQTFIEHEIYDILEIDIVLEEYGMPCIIDSGDDD